MSWTFPTSQMPSDSFFSRLIRRSDRMRQFDALWAMSDADLDKHGLKRQSLATLVLADPGLN